MAKKKTPTTAKLKPLKEKLKKTQLVDVLADYVPEGDVNPKTVVKSVLEGLAETMERSVMPGGCGEFMLPGLVKINTKQRPAIKKGTMVRKPGSSDMVPSKGRPASMRVRARALARLRKAAQK